MEILKEKIAQAIRADFIGDIVFDEDEINTMKDECRLFYRAAQSSWSKIYRREDIDELIVLIVNIAKIGMMKAKEGFGQNSSARFSMTVLSLRSNFMMSLNIH